jgi:SWI/SNF-related matrix-associated actin-dependent regulator of chromatin subfamily A-like protein 1
LAENGAKFLVFAHHHAMIDALEEYVIKEKIGYVRIDGRINAEKRHKSVQNF